MVLYDSQLIFFKDVEGDKEYCDKHAEESYVPEKGKFEHVGIIFDLAEAALVG